MSHKNPRHFGQKMGPSRHRHAAKAANAHPSRNPSHQPSRPAPTDKREKRTSSERPVSRHVDSQRPVSQRPVSHRADSQRPAVTPQGIFLWGLHAAKEAWINPSREIYRLWTTQAGTQALSGAMGIAALDGLNRPPPTIVDRQDLDRMLPPGSVHQGVVLDVQTLPETALHAVIGRKNPPDLIVVLDQVTDPHNVGAILRSAAAFGAGAVVMTERNAPATTGVLAKTACGAVEHVPTIHVPNLARALNDLQEAGYWCVGLAEEAERDLACLDLSGRTALILGNEGEGLRRLTREHCDELARLPTSGPIASLNVSNAAAVALYETRKQKKKFVD